MKKGISLLFFLLIYFHLQVCAQSEYFDLSQISKKWPENSVTDYIETNWNAAGKFIPNDPEVNNKENNPIIKLQVAATAAIAASITGERNKSFEITIPKDLVKKSGYYNIKLDAGYRVVENTFHYTKFAASNSKSYLEIGIGNNYTRIFEKGPSIGQAVLQATMSVFDALTFFNIGAAKLADAVEVAEFYLGLESIKNLLIPYYEPHDQSSWISCNVSDCIFLSSEYDNIIPLNMMAGVVASAGFGLAYQVVDLDANVIFNGISIQDTAEINDKPIISVLPKNNLDFGEVVAGKSKSKILTVTNIGKNKLIGSLSLINVEDNAFQISGSNTYSLLENQSKTFEILFQPKHPKVYTANLKLSSDPSYINTFASRKMVGIGKTPIILETSYVSKVKVIPKELVTLVFDINSPFSVPVDAWLGATIIKHDQHEYWASDGDRDLVITLLPGTNQYSRQFLIPENMPTGIYDVYFGIHSGNVLHEGDFWYSLNKPSALEIVNTTGWELEVTNVGAVPTYMVSPGTVNLTAGVHNNSNSPDKNYNNVPYKFQILDPSGNQLKEIAGQINTLNQLESTSINANFIPGQALGVYTIIFTILPDKDDNLSNNTQKTEIIVGTGGPTHQFYITSSEAWIKLDADHYSHYYNGHTYTLRNFTSSEIYISVDNDLSNYDIIKVRDFREYNNGQDVLIAEGSYYSPSEFVQVSFGSSKLDYVTFDQTNISCFPGEEKTFVAHCSDPTFIDVKPYIYRNETVKEWFSTNVNINDGGSTANYKFQVPTNAKPDKYTFWIGTKLGNNSKFLRELTITVLSPPPQISSISNNIISADDEITIKGSNLGSSGTVRFNNINCSNIISWDNTMINCVVPEGITDGFVTVSNSHGTSNLFSYNVISSTGDPVIKYYIPDHEINPGDTMFICDLNNVFNDPNGDDLTYTATSSNPDITIDQTELSDHRLALIAKQEVLDSSIVIISAKDLDNAVVTDEFIVHVPHRLEVTPTSVIVNSESGYYDFNVLSNINWNVTENVDWLSITKTSNSSFRVEYDKNDLNLSRSVYILISGDNVSSSSILFTQKEANPYLILNPKVLNVPILSGEYTVKVITNMEWNISEDVNWLNSVKINDSSAIILYDKSSLEERTGHVIVSTTNELSDTIKVIQSINNPYITTSRDTIYIDYMIGSNDTVTIKSNVSWNIMVDQDWLNIDPVSGTNNSIINLSAKSENTYPSARKAVITITDGTIFKSFYVLQNGMKNTDKYQAWKYRRIITIDNSSNNSALLDYQINVIFSSQQLIDEGKLKNDLSDLRFISMDESEEYYYWIENGEGLNNPDSRVYVKIPNIPANTHMEILMLYGNTDAESVANGDSTFYFFDDFNGTDLDNNIWQPGCFGMKPIQNVSVTGSVLAFSGNGCGGSCIDGVSLCLNKTLPSNQHFAVETRFRFTGSTWGSGAGLWRENQLVPINTGSGCQHNIPNNVALYSENFYNTNWDLEYAGWDSLKSHTLLASLDMNGPWYKSSLIRKDPSTFEGVLYDDKHYLINSSEYVVTDFVNSDMKWVTTAVYECGARKYYYDWIFIRNYTNPEPIINIGAENVMLELGGPYYGCEGDTISLDAGSDFQSYTWNTSANSQVIEVNQSGVYIVTVTDQLGNVYSDTAFVELLPVPKADAGSDKTISKGESTTLSATGGESYLWSTGDTTQNIIVSPIDTTVYQVTVTSNGCSATDEVKVNVVPVSASHFEPVWWPGNGFDHMNLYILTATLDGVDLQPGDEIGVYDGNVCVGVGVLTEILTGSNYLQCTVSRNDPDTPEKDGYTQGDPVTFRIWDASESKEVSYVKATYITGQGIFEINASATLNLSAFNFVEQQVDLLQNWNILSFSVEPENMSMMAIVSSLIDNGTLLKVQDEQGNAIEKLPAPIGWINNIGDMAVTEGYKIKVSNELQITLSGQPISLPVDIPLLAGWNIIGYPVFNSQPALTIFQPFIDAGVLQKVQDEQGNAIEKLPDPIGWIDNIHTLFPGEGYKVKVNENTTLTINDAPVSKGSYVKTTALLPDHFRHVYTGNGLDQMNVYLLEPTKESKSLKPGDEIAVFDGEYCVGATVIRNTQNEYISIVASKDDPTTKKIDGYREGHTLILKLWDAGRGVEMEAREVTPVKGYTKQFKKMGTIVLKADFEASESDFLGDVYPNPSTGKTTFTYGISVDSHVRLVVYNVTGEIVKVLIDRKIPKGIHEVVWDNKSGNGEKVHSGTYFYRIITDDFSQVKQLVVYY